MKVSASCNNRTYEVDIPYLDLSLEQLVAVLGEDQVMAALNFAITTKAQQEIRRLLRANRDDDTIKHKLATWSPFPYAARALTRRLLKDAIS